MTNPHDPNAAAEHVCEETLDKSPGSARRAYERPQLAVLGTVRELTRASAGSWDDGALGRQRSN